MPRYRIMTSQEFYGYEVGPTALPAPGDGFTVTEYSDREQVEYSGGPLCPHCHWSGCDGHEYLNSGVCLTAYTDLVRD